MYSSEVKEFAKEKEEMAKRLSSREYEESADDRSEGRDAYMRDYARVLYSSSFRRLQGKMQLLGLSNTDFIRNRLTHSLEVAQLSRNIAFDLGLSNPVVAETCALLHDIGNPPFGHRGGRVINELILSGNSLFVGDGGYEGNAQAMRIVRALEKKNPAYPGLNLTCRTLWGMVKYFYRADQGESKFLYNADYGFLRERLDGAEISDAKSIDAQIMDISDEIAYAAHDLEDALSVGLVGIGEVVHEFRISSDYSEAYSTLEELVKASQKIANGSKFLKTSAEYSAVFRKELTAKIVNLLCRDIDLVGGEAGCLGYRNYAKLAEGLKKLVFKAVLSKTEVQQYEIRGEKVIRGLFEVYSDEKFNKKLMLLPAELREMEGAVKRKAADYISGMMDAFAAKEYIKYFGEGEYNRLCG